MTQKTTAIFGIAVLAAILLGGLTFSQSAFAGASSGGPGGGQVKVTLCHIDQETGEEITITVGEPAVPAHMAHGDTSGACSDEPEPPATCEECLVPFDIAIDECDDSACEKSALQALADCTLTCTGEVAGAPEFCWNTEAGPLASCLESAETDEDIDECNVDYFNALFICAFP